MKSLRLFATLALCLISVLGLKAQGLDSLTRRNLSDKLDEYLAAIETSGTDVQKEEADFLIESVSDSLVRQFVAVKVYNHYFTSKVMGAEAVAIHVLDKWFVDGTVKMYNDIDLLNARVFADFNRQSLIGNKAPALTLKNRGGEPVECFADDARAYGILYFYDAGCAKCKLETPRLVRFLAGTDYPVELTAVYAGDNVQAWDEYVEKYFSEEKTGSARVTHLWDPEIDSDFQRKYGVIQTPRMFLIAPDGTIIGRGLDTSALELLLDQELAVEEFQYGSPDAEDLFQSLLGPNPTMAEVVEISNMLAASTLDKGNVKMFKQLAGDYLYFLAPKNRQPYRYGLNHHIRRYIIDRPDVWNTEDDSLKIVGFAHIMHDLINKAPAGQKIASVKVKGTLLKNGKEKVRNMKLSRMKGKINFIIFHTTGCPVCTAEIAEAHRLSEAYDDMSFFLVNVDEVMASSPSKAAELFDSFDLSSLPQIVLTDKNNIVRSCYVSLIDSNLMELYPLMGRVS